MTTSFNKVVDLSALIDHVTWQAAGQFFTTTSSFPVDEVRLTQIIKAAFVDTIGQYNRALGVPPSFAETVVSRNMKALQTLSDVFSPITNLSNFEDFVDRYIYIPIEAEVSSIVNGNDVVSLVSHPNSNIFIIGLSRA